MVLTFYKAPLPDDLLLRISQNLKQQLCFHVHGTFYHYLLGIHSNLAPLPKINRYDIDCTPPDRNLSIHNLPS